MILEKIKDPSSIQKLNTEEMNLLAKEVRKRIIDVVSKTGGHIAASLGVVELTIALLNVFDPLKDRIVWDVGHQSYSWKILTGRNDRFETLRSFNGLSGFTNREESPYDAFTTGHSSTSVSAALGLACGRDLNRETGHCIAIIGDGALTGGMSFEALNHAGQLQKDKFLVILNDNAMSISPNVGGLQKYLARMLASRPYNTLKQQIWDLSATLPSNLRKTFILGAQKLEESMMNILVPNIIFEDLGFKYIGPIDGHNINLICTMLRRIQRHMVGPVLLHVVTQKGKGYLPAEKESVLFHGVEPFDADKGILPTNGKKSWSEVFGSTLCEIAEKNPQVVAITAAMSSGTGLTPFEKRFPKRFFDVGIAEQHSVTFAAGLACKGIKPFVAIYSTFLQRAIDQVIHDVALPKLPVVFCIDRAGLVGEDGPTHHGSFDISLLNAIPNLMIFSPANDKELIAMLNFASTYTKGPIAIRYPRGTAFLGEDTIPEFIPGKAQIVKQGENIALLSEGGAWKIALETWNLLNNEGLNPWLINLRSLKPLDEELLKKLGKTCSFIFTFETNMITGGVGSRIGQLLEEEPCKVINFGYPDFFVPQGKIEQLNELIGFTPAHLSQEIKRHLSL
jgi:1-deoxy-D-xylulose-5-phosphate synthase